MTTQLLKSKKKPAAKRGSNGRGSSARTSDIIINGNVHIPPWVTDHDSFRRWACSDEFPQRGQFFYLDGQLWVDLNSETFIHNQIKGSVLVGVGSIVRNEELGKFTGSRMMLTHVSARLSCEPACMFISNETLESERVTLADGDQSLEILGTPDMVLEVVSATSVAKDAQVLMELYARAGIAEYWLVDSTVETPELVILRLSGGKFVTARKHDGWAKSHVFGRSFRLTCTKDAKGLPHFKLETK